jgi:hypothetical protein
MPSSQRDAVSRLDPGDQKGTEFLARYAATFPPGYRHTRLGLNFLGERLRGHLGPGSRVSERSLGRRRLTAAEPVSADPPSSTTSARSQISAFWALNVIARKMGNSAVVTFKGTPAPRPTNAIPKRTTMATIHSRSVTTLPLRMTTAPVRQT